MTDIPVEVVSRARADLGESPLWHGDEGAFYWVDINGDGVFRYDPGTGAVDTVHTGEQVTILGEVEGGGLLMVSSQRVSVLARGGIETVAELTLREGVRSNDGKCDPWGRLWFGTMDLLTRDPIGTLYRLDGSQAVPIIEEVILSNGLGWSPSGQIFYHIDTVRRLLYRHDYDPDTGDVANREVLVDMTDHRASPDGMAVDAEGNLWVAMYNGWRIDVYDPAGAKVDTVPLDVQRPTSVAFGGGDLSDLYITSAVNGLVPDQLENQPLAGHVLRMTPGVNGLAVGKFSPTV